MLHFLLQKWEYAKDGDTIDCELTASIESFIDGSGFILPNEKEDIPKKICILTKGENNTFKSYCSGESIIKKRGDWPRVKINDLRVLKIAGELCYVAVRYKVM